MWWRSMMITTGVNDVINRLWWRSMMITTDYNWCYIMLLIDCDEDLWWLQLVLMMLLIDCDEDLWWLQLITTGVI